MKAVVCRRPASHGPGAGAQTAVGGQLARVGELASPRTVAAVWAGYGTVTDTSFELGDTPTALLAAML
jgi:hypothetical protein